MIGAYVKNDKDFRLIRSGVLKKLIRVKRVPSAHLSTEILNNSWSLLLRKLFQNLIQFVIVCRE